MENHDEVDPLGSVSRSKLHFFWVADCSGSMKAQGKIQALNNAIHECIPSVREANKANPFADMMVRAIRFSTGAQWHIPAATRVDDFRWKDLTATGVTDLGKYQSKYAWNLTLGMFPQLVHTFRQ